MAQIDSSPILAGLNDRQLEAVKTTQGPVLVVAGPGSGKTRVLTCRIAWLLAHQEAEPYQILALTFTNKAAREMNERVKKLLPKGMTKGMWVGTFHSLMARLLRVEAEHLGFTSDFTIYDTDDCERLLKQLIVDHGLDPKQIKARSIQYHISMAKNRWLSAHQIKSDAKGRSALAAARLFDSYAKALLHSNAFDFDDLLLKPLELFKRFPEVLQKYQRKWSHILIDEYQDTNHVQYLLAQQLSGIHRNLCVVGDDAQSIYSFRGANIKNIISFEKDFPEAKIVRLEENYRSTTRILNAADSLISNNVDRIEKKLWTDNGMGAIVKPIRATNDIDEALKTARKIRTEVNIGRLNYKDFAILYRTNEQSRRFEDALQKDRIPYRLVGGLSFYQRREVRDAISYLRLLVNPNDLSSFKRVVNYPTRGIGAKSQQKIMEYARQEGYTLKRTLDEVDDIQIPKKAKDALREFAKMIHSHTKKVRYDHHPSKIVASLFRDSGFFGELESDDTQTGQRRLENVHQLIGGLEEYEEADQSSPLSRYLQKIALITNADEDDSSDNKVTLMTLHASKGLEFSVVFIVGVEEKLLPLIRHEKITSEEIEEERRLFYVGITRAKSQLYICWACSRKRYGGDPKQCIPSRFINELNLSNIKTSSLKLKKNSSVDKVQASSNVPQQPLKRTEPITGATSRPSLRSRPAAGFSDPVKIHDLSKIQPKVVVRHKDYGYGFVMETEGEGDNKAVMVDFGPRGKKKLRVKFAPMEIIG